MLNNNYLQSNSNNYDGSYRAMLLYDGVEARIFIPGMYCSQIKESDLEGMKKCFPIAIFASVQMRETAFIGQSPCYVVFENGDLQRPIVTGYFGKGIRSIGVSSVSINDYTFYNNYETDESVNSKISGNKSDKINWLFDGNGLPTSSTQMSKYLSTFTIPIINESGIKTTMKITMHKKLEYNIINIFTEISNIGFKIIAKQTGGYNWRMTTSGKSRSQHSYGTCIDINWNYNPYYSNPSTKLPTSEYAITSKVVSIFAKYGWSWGGNWTSSKDYMHFSYLGG